MTKKVKPEQDWKFRDAIKKIVDKNCTEIPYEGTEVNKEGIVAGIVELLSSKEYSLLHHVKPVNR